jgi:hypothetical protein
VLSLGGNDALGHVDLLEQRVNSSAEVLDRFATAAARFETRYRAAVEALRRRDVPITICTILQRQLPRSRLPAAGVDGVVRLQRREIIRVAFENALAHHRSATRVQPSR